MLGYGMEGLTNPTAHELYLVSNTFVNERSSAIFVSVQNGIALCKMYNNIFAGNGTILSGTATKVDSTHNIYGSITAAGMVNATMFDYHLNASSPAINKGVYAGLAGAFALLPMREYVSPVASITRAIHDSIDIGAHEFGPLAGVVKVYHEIGDFCIQPNPNTGQFRIIFREAPKEAKNISLFDASGKIVFSTTSEENLFCFFDETLAAGVYTLQIRNSHTIQTKRVVIK